MPNELPWLKVGAVEVANAARTVPYIRSMASEKFEVTCNLPGVLTRITDCPGALLPPTSLTPSTSLLPDCNFADPASDPAPWYDATQPESGHFLGLLINRIRGLEMTADRTVTPIISGLQGGRVGVERLQPRKLVVEGALIAANARCDAIAYGMRWLGEVLGQSQCDACTLPSLEVRLAAPVPDDGSNDDEGHWITYGAGLTGISYPDNSVDPHGCDYQEVALEFTTENPWFYKPAATLLAATSVNPGGAATGTIPFDQWYCSGVQLVSVALPVPNIGVNAAVVTLTGGAIDASGLSVFAGTPLYPSPALFPSPCLYPQSASLAGTPSYPPPCPVVFNVPNLPAGSTLVVDSAQQRVVYTGPDGIEVDGVGMLDVPVGEAVRWIDSASCDQPQAVAASAAAVCASDALFTATIEYQHRER